jgi:hypothetical protein
VRPCERDRVNELEERSSKAPKITKEMLIIWSVHIVYIYWNVTLYPILCTITS